MARAAWRSARSTGAEVTIVRYEGGLAYVAPLDWAMAVWGVPGESIQELALPPRKGASRQRPWVQPRSSNRTRAGREKVDASRQEVQIGTNHVAGLAVVALLIVISTFVRMYRKVAPNQALIVYGFGGTRIVQGGGTVVMPMVQSARELSLELMSFDVAPTQDLYTNQGVAVNVEAVAQIKVKSDPDSIRTAAEQFLSKPQQEREDLIRLVMEGHLRGIVGQLTVESLVKEPEMVSDRVRANVADDMDKMGLEVVSFTIREVRDKNEYIANMGKPDIALIQRQADIAAAEADRDTAIKRAQAMREAAIAQAGADQERVIAQTASQTKQAEAIRDLDLEARAEYESTVQAQQATDRQGLRDPGEHRAAAGRRRAGPDPAGREGAAGQGAGDRNPAPREGTDRDRSARCRDRAPADRDARRRREPAPHAGGARACSAEKARGFAEAEIARARGTPRPRSFGQTGTAEAEIIQAKGQAEAEAMEVKANAYSGYGQAAILDRLLGEHAGVGPRDERAAVEGRQDHDRLDRRRQRQGGIGSAAMMNDVTKMIAQAPALFEGLTGMKLGDLMKRGPGNRRGDRAVAAQRVEWGRAAAPTRREPARLSTDCTQARDDRAAPNPGAAPHCALARVRAGAAPVAGPTAA